MTDTPSDWMSNLQGPPVKWTSTTRFALLALVALWAALFWATWATWGNLTIDCGRDMYVPVALLKGKMLYRDVWYVHGPLAPYFNSLLFRVFGVHLTVLYWTGALSALFSGVFLYLTGMELGSWVAGIGAASIVQVQAFESSFMSFPLPYSFASVYGCLTACLFIWLIVRSCKSTKLIWIFGAGCAAAVAFLLKLEFGFACYATLGILIVVRAAREGWKSFVHDCATVLPGVVACLWVTGWMVSIHGVRFITEENIVSWPTSYFMRRYGKQALALTGCTITPKALGGAALWTLVLLASAFAANRILDRVKSDKSRFFVWAPLAILAALAVLWVPWRGSAGLTLLWVFPWIGIVNVNEWLWRIVFPNQLICIIAVAAGVVWLRTWLERRKELISPAALVFTFSSLLAFRLLVGMMPSGYSIYYDGPAVLSFLVLAGIVIPRSARSRLFVMRAELLIVMSAVAMVCLHAIIFNYHIANRVPLVTDAGTIKVSKPMAESYTAAIDWMKSANARGQAVLSVPEDMSLYFLSGTDCPTRLIEFTPGIVVPGGMTNKLITELDAKQIPYLLWSNRKFPEWGTPVFGTDYDRELGDYFKSHYRPVRALTDYSAPLWNAVIWERISYTKAQ